MRKRQQAVYLIASLNIHDRERYGQYEAGFMDIFAAYEGEMLAVDETPDVLEGDYQATRTVLIRFPSQDAADDWFNSEAYQALATHRHAASTGSIIRIKAFD